MATAKRLLIPQTAEASVMDDMVHRLARFVKQQAELAKAKRLVIGMSGGLDSSVSAGICALAVGGKKVLGVSLPEEETHDPDSIDDARAVASKFGIQLTVTDISPPLRSIKSIIGKDRGKMDLVAWGNIKARMRALILYYHANISDGLVVGTGDKSELLLGYFCYDEKTRVVTREGLKDRTELKRGDIVFSFDVETHNLVELPVENVYEFDYTGEMYHFKSQNGDLLVTPNHKMLVQTSAGKVLFRRADEAARHSQVVIPIPRAWNGEPNLPMTVPITFSQEHIERTIRVSIEDMFYIAGLFIGDGSIAKGSVSVPVKSHLTRTEYQTVARNDHGQFVTLFQTDPHLKTYESYETNFALPSYTKPEIRNRLIRILDKYGIGYSQTRDLVRISSKAIYEFFSQFGIGARNKHIPSWMLRYNSTTLQSLMSGLEDSDGSHDYLNGTFYTSSRMLKDGVVELLAKLGKLATIRVRPPHVTRLGDKTIRSGESYEIYYSVHRPKTKHFQNSRTEIVQYNGKVWCPSVVPFENILVERNGKYAFCGNTKFGDGACDIQPLADVYKTTVRQLAVHLKIPSRISMKVPSPNLWPGQTAEGELEMDYDRIDPILSGLERWIPSREIARELAVPLGDVRKVEDRWRRSEHKRRMPLTAKLGFRTIGMDFRLPYNTG